jgi:thymidylate synthase (FAD)
MQVRLVSLTQSMIEGVNSPEELIVHNARASNPSNQMNTATADKLIFFLIREKHISPFEQADMGVEVKTSRAIAAQILRHWTLSIQEFSQRYAAAVEFEPVELRKSGATNRQSSLEVFDPEIDASDGCPIEGKASELIANHLQYSMTLYKALLDANVAKECARMILPLTTQTTLYLKGDIRTWIFYLAQRTSTHAQLEHRLIAQQIEGLFSTHFPNTHKAITRMFRQEAAFKEWLKLQPADEQ